MATHKYRIYDRTTNQPVTPEIDSVLDVVTLASVATTSGSAEITCTSTTGVFPFMACTGPNIPAGAWVAAVKNSTTLVLAMVLTRPSAWVTGTAYVVGDYVYSFARDMVFRCTVAHTAGSTFQPDFVAGKWTAISEPYVIPAKATATASSLTAHCHGLSPLIPEEVFTGQTWRNEFNPSLKTTTLSYNGSTLTAMSGNQLSGGYVPVPGSEIQVTGGSPVIALNDLRAMAPDSVAGVPERSRRVWQSMLRFIHSGGTYSQFPMTPDFSAVRTGAGT